MKFLLALCILISCSHEVLSADISSEPLPGSLRFVLYNDTFLMNLVIHKDGIDWDLDLLQIEARKGLQIDPATKAVLWNEDGILTKGYLTNKSSSKIWVPERLGRIFHYDWHKRWIYWYSETNEPEEKLKISDLNAREVFGVKTIDSGSLEAIDSKNELFIYKTVDSLKMYQIDGLLEKYSIQIDNSFHLMDIIPTDQVVVVLQSRHSNDEDNESDIKLYNYDGEVLHSVPVNEVYDSVFFQEPLLVMKHKSEITVLDMESQEILYKLQRKQFMNMTLKHLKHINEMDIPAQSTYALKSNCKETDNQEVCILNEDSEDEDDRCVYQSYIVSNGTSFNHYNPASKMAPHPLPFRINGSIRNFDTYKREKIFWIDDQTNSIMINYIYMDTESEKLDYQTIYPTDLKVDERQRYVFWSDKGKETIEVSDFDGLAHKVLFTDVHMPQKILLALDYGSVIWTEGENNDTIVIGSIEDGSKTILFQSKEPIFGFAFDYIYNILYVGSQSDHLFIHAVNFNLGLNRRVFKSKITTTFFDILYSRNNVYLLGLGMFWKFHPWSQKLHAVSGAAFNSSFVSPIVCEVSSSRQQLCGMCKGLCLSSTQGSMATVKSKNCVPLNLTTKGESYCDSKRFLFATTSREIFRLTDNIHCSTWLFRTKQSINARQPIAYDATSNQLYLAVSNSIHRSNLQVLSWSEIMKTSGNILEVVYTGLDDKPIVRFTSSSNEYQWVSSDNVRLSNPMKPEQYRGYPYHYGNHQYGGISLPDTSVSVIAYQSQNVFFYIQESFIYCHSKSSSSRRQVAPVPSHVRVIRISYEENRIYYWDANTLHSVRLDGKKHRQSVFEVPVIKTFAFLDKVMYFVSEEDGRLYELDHNSKSTTKRASLVEEQVKDIINLINFPSASSKVNNGCESLRDDDGECFHITM